MKPLIAITMGDPAGIGPEIIAKAFVLPEIHRWCRPVVAGDLAVFETVIRQNDLPLRIQEMTEAHTASPSRKKLVLFNCVKVALSEVKPGIPTAETGRAALQAIQAAVRLASDGTVSAVTTAPISKEALKAAGSPHPGHTELLADLTRSSEVGMLLLAPIPEGVKMKHPPRPGGPAFLRIMLATTHLALRDVPVRLTSSRVLTAIRLAYRSAREHFGIFQPKVAVAGLNPHAGEGGLFGSEEGEAILPAMEQARLQGMSVMGPFPADTLMVKAARGEYDMVVAMYHDQALIPIKMLAFGRAVNMTVGLPFLRTSVDHGTAYDIAGRGIADPGSLIEAITLAAKLTPLGRNA